MPKRQREASQDCVEAGPYPKHQKPTEQEIVAVHACLAALHPESVEKVRTKKEGTVKNDEGSCGSRKLVLDALVGTILSQNTTDVNSHRAFAALKAKFPEWDTVRTADPSEIEDAIRPGGLAAIKTGRIQTILNTIYEERGKVCLEHLRDESNDDVKAALKRFKGVGAKTISCVLLFCLNRDDFPVDTHVWKIAVALGWVPKAADRDGTYEHLNLRVPDELKYELHVLLVEHGKQYKNQVTVLRKLLADAELGVTRRVEEELTATRTEKATKVKSEAKVGGTSPEHRSRGEKPMAKLECD